ncbi:hypothetical protein SDC9_117779 [bioreactor metagenome]|uniref:Uncharacterized protein n=1 Tax=bioreactor metagenome TaxID=1076179 RepID=A0A645C0G2_9ZZZZ
MVVCQDVTILGINEAGAFAPLGNDPLLHPASVKAILSKKFLKEWVPAERITHYSLFDHSLCVNVNNGRRAFFNYRNYGIAVVDILCLSTGNS